MVIEMINPGWVAAIFAFLGAVWKAIQAKDATHALEGLGKLLNSQNKEVTKTSNLNKQGQKVLNENFGGLKMSDTLKAKITDGLAESRKTEILQEIYDNENDGIPGDKYLLNIPEKGVKYEIFAGKIQNIIELGNLTGLSGNIGDPGSCEIVRVWGGRFSTGGNIPQKQPEEITVDMSSRRLFVNCKAVEVGSVTLALFINRKLVNAKIADFQANDIDAAKENQLSYSVYHFRIPSDIIQDVRETDEEFDIVIAWARGGKWYYLLDTEVAEVPWEGQVSLKAICS